MYVVWRFLSIGGGRPSFHGRVPAAFLVPLAAVAGFMDAIGGGGWGPVGTPTLLASGKIAPRKVIGSIDTSEFVVSLGASAGFLLALGSQNIDYGMVVALLIGGVAAAPLAAWLVRLLAPRILAIGAGGLIIVTNARTLLRVDAVQNTLPDAAPTLVLAGLAVLWAGALVWVIRREVADRRATPARTEVRVPEKV